MCYKLPFREEKGNPSTSCVPRAFPNLVPRSPTAKGKGLSLFIVKQSETLVSRLGFSLKKMGGADFFREKPWGRNPSIGLHLKILAHIYKSFSGYRFVFCAKLGSCLTKIQFQNSLCQALGQYPVQRKEINEQAVKQRTSKIRREERSPLAIFAQPFSIRFPYRMLSILSISIVDGDSKNTTKSPRPKPPLKKHQSAYGVEEDLHCGWGSI